MPNSRPILTVVVTPGTPCKIELPPCSALEIKQAALSSIEPLPAERCVLECDLASHSFVLCSIIPSGPHQAALGTVITNDPDERAWVFLKARGPRAFHVICQLVVDDSKPDASPAELVVQPVDAVAISVPAEANSAAPTWSTKTAVPIDLLADSTPGEGPIDVTDL